MSQYSAAFASFLAALTGEADMSTGGASLGGGGAASSHPAMALAVAEDALSGLESRLVRAGVDSMDGEEGRPHAGRVMRLLHLGDRLEVAQHISEQLPTSDGSILFARRNVLKLGITGEIQQSASQTAFVHAINDDVINANSIQADHGIATGPSQTGACLPRWPRSY